MADQTAIFLPLWQLPLLVVVPLATITIVSIWLRRLAGRQSAPEEEPDWSVPPLNGSGGDSLLHRWDVRCKIVTILAYSFIVASLNHLKAALAAMSVSLLMVALSRVTLARTVFRLTAITGFLSMLLVIMPLTVPFHPGDTLVVFGDLDWLVFNLRGLVLAATISAKAVAIAMLMEPLLSTAPLPVTIQGLSKLGVPEIVGQMILISSRYVHVFRHEAGRMATGMRARGFRNRTGLETVRATAGFLGMLFVRSFERTERVFEAMRARGYEGRFPEATGMRLRPWDVLLALIWIGAGAALMAYDRLAW